MCCKKIWMTKWKNPIDLNCKFFFFSAEKKITWNSIFFVVSRTDAHMHTNTHLDFLMRRQFWWSRLFRCDVMCAVPMRCHVAFPIRIIGSIHLIRQFLYSVYVMFLLLLPLRISCISNMWHNFESVNRKSFKKPWVGFSGMRWLYTSNMMTRTMASSFFKAMFYAFLCLREQIKRMTFFGIPIRR